MGIPWLTEEKCPLRWRPASREKTYHWWQKSVKGIVNPICTISYGLIVNDIYGIDDTYKYIYILILILYCTYCIYIYTHFFMCIYMWIITIMCIYIYTYLYKNTCPARLGIDLMSLGPRFPILMDGLLICGDFSILFFPKQCSRTEGSLR